MSTTNKINKSMAIEKNKDKMLLGSWQNSGNYSDQAIKSLAATLVLPSLVWPSFHLPGAYVSATPCSSGSTTKQTIKLVASSLEPSYSQPDRASTRRASIESMNWPMQYTQVSRVSSPKSSSPPSPAAASEHRPTFLSAEDQVTTTSSSNTTERAATLSSSSTTGRAQTRAPSKRPASSKQPTSTRKKRKKPDYLAFQARTKLPSSQHNRASLLINKPNSSYPESTRLASRYPMPRLKFAKILPNVALTATTNENNNNNSSGNGQQQQQAPGFKAQESAKSTIAAQAQLPRNLSKLIQMQLAANLTTQLGNQLRQFLAHQQQQHNSTMLSSRSLAPSTSVSKVVRLVGGMNASTLEHLPLPASVRTNISMMTSAVANNNNNTFEPQLVDLKRVEKQIALVANATLASDDDSQRKRTTDNLFSSLAPMSTSLPVTSNLLAAVKNNSSLGNNVESSLKSLESRVQSLEAKSTTTTTVRPDADTRPSQESSSMSENALEMSTTLAPKATASTVGTQTPTTTTPTTLTTTTAKKFGQNVANGAGQPKKARESKRSKETINGEVGEQLEKSHKLHRPQKLLKVSAKTSNNNNIKLFHFNRKPDANKLPFYKRPLNITELGWTNEQIQEHLRLEALAAAKADQSSDGEIAADTSDGADTQAADQNAGRDGSSATSSAGGLVLDEDQQTVGASLEANNLLKRKRRAKNQFERLMAELQLAAAATATLQDQPSSSQQQQQQQVGGQQGSVATRAVDTSASDLQSQPQNTQVPVMRRKHEQLVMKPMFLVMNQKRRHSVAAALAAAPAPFNSSIPVEIDTGGPGLQATKDPMPSANNNTASSASNRPIVRMRRKHNSEQAIMTNGLIQNDSNDWRPSKPIWSMASSSPKWREVDPKSSSANAAMQLLLVPSSLLTPSGSHPMPLFTPSGKPWRRPVARPTISDTDRPLTLSPSSTGRQLISGPAAMAPYLGPPASEPFNDPSTVLALAVTPKLDYGAASSSPVVTTNVDDQRQQMNHLATRNKVNQAESSSQNKEQANKNRSNNGELRVPKLLVKPMRPAKYSLNGYIPKPSLLNALPAIGQSSSSLLANQFRQQQSRSPVNSMTNRSSSPKRQLMASNQQQQQSSMMAPFEFQKNNKDLDSSTSNEIFSRRRGIQQQQLELQKQASLDQATDTLGRALVKSTQSMLTNHTLDQMQRQMEENRRKYVQQAHLALRAPQALSLQKVNQLKAKLGLSQQPGIMVKINHKKRAYEAAAAAELNSAFNLAPDNSVDAWQQTKATHQLASHLDPPTSTATSYANAKAAANNELSDGQMSPAVKSIGAPLSTIPKTDFECTDKRGRFVVGLFADEQTGCQVWHLCSNNRKYSFLCPSGTIFNAKLRICDWRYNVRCAHQAGPMEASMA